jgi:hypothetical protein
MPRGRWLLATRSLGHIAQDAPRRVLRWRLSFVRAEWTLWGVVAGMG